MKNTRTDKRSRSGAHEQCPHCAKLLRGSKGLKMHLAEQHPEEVAKAKAGAA